MPNLKILQRILLLVLYGYSSLILAQNLIPPAAAIASSHPLATSAGKQILQQGGNAFDAAVAIGAVLAVVEPYESGLGGGGFFLLHDARHTPARNVMVDARERAPLAAKSNMYITAGKVDVLKSKQGALAAAIPGEVAGLVHVAKNYGKLPLSQTLAAAISLAQDGFKIDQRFIDHLSLKQSLIEQYPASKNIFLPDGKIPPVNSLFKQPDLGRVLIAIAAHGNAGFYEGEVAAELVAGVRAGGGVWQAKDLASYQIHEQVPLKGQYRQLHLIVPNLPSAGGIGVLAALNILSDFELLNLSEVDRNHLLIESLRRVYCDRIRYLGDAHFNRINVQHLLSSSHAAQLRATINMDKATPSQELNCGIVSKEGEHTTHFSVLDQEGNAVGATLTNNHWFGSGFVPPGTGIVLNNEMDDFAVGVGVPNGFDLMGNLANNIQPGKTPLSSMTPTFFEVSNGFGILGTPGGSRIPSMTLIALLTAQQDLSPMNWVSKGRFHEQFSPDVVSFEPEGLSVPMQNALAAKGHKLKSLERPYGNMQAIFWDQKANKVYAASDPRGQGVAWVGTVNAKKTF